MNDEFRVMNFWYLLYLLLLCGGHSVLAQTTFFNRAIDFNGQVDLSFHIMHVTDSSYVSIGKSLNLMNANEGNYLVYITSKDGSIDTVKNYYFTHTKYWGGHGEKTQDGNYIHLSTKVLTNIGDQDLFLAKLTLLGDTLWTKTYGDTNYISNGVDVVENADGTLILIGWEYEKNGWDSRLFLLKTDHLGNIVWRKNYQRTNYLEQVFNMIGTDDGGVVFACVERPNGGDDRGLVYKVDSTGAIVWKNYYVNNIGESFSIDIVSSLEGGYMVAGAYEVPGNDGVFRGALLKIDENGYREWDKKYGYPNSFGMDLTEGFNKIMQLPDSSYALLGSTRNADLINDGILGEDDGWLLKTDKEGNELWSRVYTNSYLATGSKIDYLYDFQSTPDGGFVAVGSCRGPVTQEAWILKLDSCGCDSISCLYDADDNCGIQVSDTIRDTLGILANQSGFNLLKVYPNPVEDYLYLVHPYVQQVDVRVVNEIGEVVEGFRIENRAINDRLDVSGYTKGVYYVHLLSNGFQRSRQFVVF